MDAETRRTVRERADDRCEYCQLRQEHAQLWRHQIEHVIPRKHRGTDDPDNLAWTCVRCNLSKSCAAVAPSNFHHDWLSQAQMVTELVTPSLQFPPDRRI